MKLDIDRLHKENKTGRRSGRTTEMLANAVGVALLAENNIDIYIVCAIGNEMDVWTHFIEVLRAVSPTSTYFRGIHNGRPCITIPLGENLVRVMFRNSSPANSWRHEDDAVSPVDEAWFFDHFWEETERVRFESLRRNPKTFISEMAPHYTRRGGYFW